MRQSSINTFSEGLNFDLNPITTPNNVLTDVINGTFITFNGDELALQNDAGNTKIQVPNTEEFVTLSPGFYPLGIKEYGGVLYIVSGNNTTNEIEFGSYPSPVIPTNDTTEDPDSVFDIVDKEIVLSNRIFRSGSWVIFDSTINSPIIDLNKFTQYTSGGVLDKKLYTFKLYHKLDKGNLDITNDIALKNKGEYWFDSSPDRYYCNSRYKGKLSAKVIITPIVFSLSKVKVELDYGEIVNETIPTLTTKTATMLGAGGFVSGGTDVKTVSNFTIEDVGIICNTVEIFDVTTENTIKIGGALSGTAFDTTVTGLLPTTLYYYKAYAMNNMGIYGYGSTKSATTLSGEGSILLTAPYEIQDTNFWTGGYQIMYNIGVSVIEKGLLWDTQAVPSFTGNAYLGTYNAGTNFYTFDHKITGLSPETLYYVRAYVKTSVSGQEFLTYSAVSQVTTAYGIPVISAFTTTKQVADPFYIDSQASVAISGTATITAKGFIWTTLNPSDLTIANNQGLHDLGVGTGVFNYPIPSTARLYVKAYATSSFGVTVYTDVKGWALPILEAPIMERPDPNLYGIYGVSDVLFDGGINVVDKGFIISYIDQAFSVGSNDGKFSDPIRPSGLGIFSVSFDDSNELYMKAYATNSSGESVYSDRIQILAPIL